MGISGKKNVRMGNIIIQPALNTLNGHIGISNKPVTTRILGDVQKLSIFRHPVGTIYKVFGTEFMPEIIAVPGFIARVPFTFKTPVHRERGCFPGPGNKLQVFGNIGNRHAAAGPGGIRIGTVIGYSKRGTTFGRRLTYIINRFAGCVLA
jgi:hypothetical protein